MKDILSVFKAYRKVGFNEKSFASHINVHCISGSFKARENIGAFVIHSVQSYIFYQGFIGVGNYHKGIFKRVFNVYGCVFMSFLFTFLYTAVYPCIL